MYVLELLKLNKKYYLLIKFRYPFDVKQSLVIPDWQLYIGDTAKQILSQQTPGKLLEVRSMLYELIIHGIPTNVIFKVSNQIIIKDFFLMNLFIFSFYSKNW